MTWSHLNACLSDHLHELRRNYGDMFIVNITQEQNLILTYLDDRKYSACYEVTFCQCLLVTFCQAYKYCCGFSTQHFHLSHITNFVKPFYEVASHLVQFFLLNFDE